MLNFEEQPPVIILGWTTVFSSSLESTLGSSFLRCKKATCRLTSNRTLLNSSHVVFFHERDFNATDLPNRRRPSQLYVISNWEPPAYLSSATSFMIDNFFNLTVTHLRNSDIYAPYVAMVKNGEVPQLIEEDLKRLVKGKTKHIAWFVSNCNTSSKRELYVKALQKYIPVDIYGSCGPLRCPRGNNNCTDFLKNDYLFYLAFENAICSDYVTEKISTALSTHIVPVVLSRAVAQSALPEGSFIAVDDFASAKSLADFLYELGNNTARYMAYFSYKQTHAVKTVTLEMSMCRLCEQVTEIPAPPTRYTKNFHEWFLESSNCTTVVVTY
ncbi:unnamed protein product [Soboliphyme baturini]|uniref:Fucosyltransferase n=1 Tax=Soboliphyme baturini TaxID=241478 RepID=A0A183IZA5_9BILA|nr:unnamed protein product [Soboliphyme baturini]